MDVATLVAGKGKRVEINLSGDTVYGTLMGQQRNKQIASFYIRLDGETRKALIAARRIVRFA